MVRIGCIVMMVESTDGQAHIQGLTKDIKALADKYDVTDRLYISAWNNRMIEESVENDFEKIIFTGIQPGE